MRDYDYNRRDPQSEIGCLALFMLLAIGALFASIWALMDSLEIDAFGYAMVKQLADDPGLKPAIKDAMADGRVTNGELRHIANLREKNNWDKYTKTITDKVN